MGSLDAGPVTGSGGSGPVTGSGGAGGEVPPPCPSTVKNLGVCSTEPTCHLDCGPLESGIKPCTCEGGNWFCSGCDYAPDGDYGCFRLNPAPSACPADVTDPTGMGLPQNGAACAISTCAPCGSATVAGYRDATGLPRIGFCVCSASDGTGTYSCAPVEQWPPQ
jgi:hypothetical protein